MDNDNSNTDMDEDTPAAVPVTNANGGPSQRSVLLSTRAAHSPAELSVSGPGPMFNAPRAREDFPRFASAHEVFQASSAIRMLADQQRQIYCGPPIYPQFGGQSDTSLGYPTHAELVALMTCQLRPELPPRDFPARPGQLDSTMQLGAIPRIPHSKRPLSNNDKVMESDAKKQRLDPVIQDTPDGEPSVPSKPASFSGKKESSLEPVVPPPILSSEGTVLPSGKTALERLPIEQTRHPKQIDDAPAGAKKVTSSPSQSKAKESSSAYKDAQRSTNGDDIDHEKKKEFKKKASSTREKLPLDELSFNSSKDELLANAFLAGKTDLLLVLSEKQCRWLAEENWIFTCEQLMSVLAAGATQLEQTLKLRLEVAQSPLIGQSRPSQQVTFTSSELDDSTASRHGVVVQGTNPEPAVKMENPPDDELNEREAPTEEEPENTGESAVSTTKKELLLITHVASQTEPAKTEDTTNLPPKPDKEDSIDTDGIDDLTSIVARATASYQSKPFAERKESVLMESPVVFCAESALMLHINDKAISDVKPAGAEDAKGTKGNVINLKNVPSPRIPTAEELEKAGKLLEEWQEMLVTFYENREHVENGFSESEKRATQFPLNGPVGCLFPKSLLNFLETIHVKTLFGYLCLKKTESSSLIPEYRAWRSHCGLVVLKDYPLARHLSGITTRIETAMDSIPPVDALTKKWMGTVLSMLTGSSKDFIITECQVSDPEFFVSERTKEWSDRLVAWRDRNKMPVLKGSGKVAMISGWKTAIKESLDAERGDGRVLSEEELSKDTPVDANESVEPKVRKKLARKPGKEFKAALYQDAEVALRSPEFLASVMKSDNTSFLRSVGITTAEQLIDVEKQIDSDITLSLVKFRTDQTKVPAHASTCVRLLYDWTQRVRAQLEEIQTDASKEFAKKRGPKAKPVEIKFVEKKSKQVPVAAGDAPHVAPDKATKVQTSVEGKKNPEKKKARHVTVHEDPMASLSVSARKFIETTTIRTAREFLSTKTTLAATLYEAWRENEGLPLLKGYGAIATISSWKAQIRKVAKALGDDELADTLPLGQLPPKGVIKKDISNEVPTQKRVGKYFLAKEGAAKESVAKEASCSLAPPKAKGMCMELPLASAKGDFELSPPTPFLNKDVLMGLPFRLFSVCSTDSSLIYDFELSVRRTEDAVYPQSVFLTFLGAMRASSTADESITPQGNVPPLLNREGCARIMRERRATEVEGHFTLNHGGTFSSQASGTGFIDLSKYGVGPIAAIDRVGEMKEILRCFIYPVEKSWSRELGAWTEQTNSNVLKRETTRGSQYLFFAKEPMERGQVVELRYSKADQSESLPIASDSGMRQYLAQEISVLSFADLIRLHHVVSQIRKKVEDDAIARTTAQSDVVVFCARRRIHWLSLKILAQINEVAIRSVSSSMENLRLQIDLLKKDVEVMLMDSTARDKMLASETPKTDPLFLALEKETTHEILCMVEEMDSLKRPFDRKVWCKLARDLLIKSIRLVASHVVLTTDDTIGAQTKLATELCKYAVEAARLLSSSEKNLDDFAFDCIYGESSEDEHGKQSQSVVATKGVDADSGSIVFTPFDNVKAGSSDLSIGWYAEHQILSVVAAVAECGLIKWMKDSGKPIFTRSTIQYALKESIENHEKLYDESKERAGEQCISNRVDVIESVRVPPAFATCKTTIMPSALPLFLGTVWPKLRRYGWRLDANQESIGEVSFVPPGQKTKAKRVSDRNKKLRDERDRKRAKMQDRILNIGFGYLSKTTKRLVVHSVVEEEELETLISVRETLEMFLEDAMSIPSENKEDQRRRVKLVVGGILTCFDELYPLMANTPTIDGTEGKNGFSDTKGAYKLIQLLMILPNVLQQSGLNLRQIEDATAGIKDVVQFLSANYTRVFDEPFQPVKEEYRNDDGISKLALSIKIAGIADGKAASLALNGDIATDGVETPVEAEIIRDLVLPDDELNLTGFQALALKQMMPCRFSGNDKRKKKSVPIGYPGIVCRHCLAANGEGKYFFSSVDSLSTAGGVSWSHLVRCSKLPKDIKTTLLAQRSAHPDERKKLKHGAMSVFFGRLWKRLHSSNTVGFSGFTVMEAMDREITSPARVEDGVVEFSSHMQVLQFLQSEASVSLKTDLKASLDTYYRCLKQGGMIYATNVMPRAPRKFSSEYLLAKMAPGAKSNLKRQTSMG